MLRDIEHDAVGAVKFGLVEAGMAGRRGVPEAIPAQRLDLLPLACEIVDQHPEMMQPDIIGPLAELIVIAEVSGSPY